MIWLVAAVAFWIGAWWLNSRIANSAQAAKTWARLFVPILFGVTILVVWECVVRGLALPLVILPAPTVIGAKFAAEIPILWADFLQTFVKGALSGYVIGCGAAFLFAIVVDRSEFLQRGLLPVSNFMVALPVGTARLPPAICFRR